MDKVQSGLDRLNAVLPLAANQLTCSDDSIELHRFLLNYFVNQADLPADEELAGRFPRWQDHVNELTDALLLDRSDDGGIRGFYPFTRETREHQVLLDGVALHCMCALDALAVSPMFNRICEIKSECRLSGQGISIKQDGTGQVIDSSPEDIHVAIAWAAADSSVSCAQSLCLEMFFIVGDEKVSGLAGAGSR